MMARETKAAAAAAGAAGLVAPGCWPRITGLYRESGRGVEDGRAGGLSQVGRETTTFHPSASVHTAYPRPHLVPLAFLMVCLKWRPHTPKTNKAEGLR